jgi:hypothetical protein
MFVGRGVDGKAPQFQASVVQARSSGLDDHRRAVAIDDAEIGQKPLFAGFPVPFDVFEFRIGVCGDGKVRQRKRKPVTGGFQESFLTRPAGIETAHAETIRQLTKPAKGEEGEEGERIYFPCLFGVTVKSHRLFVSQRLFREQHETTNL